MKPFLLAPNQFPVGKEDEQDVRDGVNKNARIFNGDPNAIDESVQRSTKSPDLPSLANLVISSFDGNNSADNQSRGFGLLVPPDPSVTVGPNHRVYNLMIFITSVASGTPMRYTHLFIYSILTKNEILAKLHETY
jgi:hypothetical protein